MAIEALDRIEGGAYANLVLPPLLDRSSLDAADRHFATELVYGTTRMRRACDWLVDRFLMRPPDPTTRNALRLGAYQLVFLATPPHAAVNATVAVAPARTRGLVNAVLRRVAAAGAPDWPGDAVRLSYPDWIVARASADLGGSTAALGALEAMNAAPPVTVRADGYVQDRASQWVAEAVGAAPGMRVADVCAAPGGKATLMAAAGAFVVAADIRTGRLSLLSSNASATRPLHVVGADGCAPPYRDGAFDRVLVDAPCSGLGVLGRRADARWRVTEDDVADLAALQERILDASVGLVRPGGVVVYSVCTLTAAETVGVDLWLASAFPDLIPLAPPGPPWVVHGRGALLLPQAAGTDGMFMLRLQAPPI